MTHSCKSCALHCLEEEKIRRLVRARLYHTQSFDGEFLGRERAHKHSEPLGEMNHREPSPMPQGICRRTHGIGKRRRDLVPRCRTSVSHADSTACSRAIGRVRKDEVECRTCKKCGRVAIIALPHRNFLRKTVQLYVPCGERRLHGIQLNRRDLLSSVRSEKGNDPRARAEIKDMLPSCEPREMRKQYGVHRKTEFVGPLDDPAPACTQIINPFIWP